MSETPDARVTRAVIDDLLPLYLAGEAGADTRALVDAWLARDPELAARVARLRADDDAPSGMDATLPPDVELRALRRTRAVLAWQRWLFGLAIGFTAVGASVSVSLGAGQPADVHLMLRDYPLPFGGCLVAAAACWVGYARLRRG